MGLRKPNSWPVSNASPYTGPGDDSRVRDFTGVISILTILKRRLVQALRDGVPMDLDEDLTIVNDGSEWLTFMFDRPFNPDKPFEGFLKGYLILKVSNAQPVQR